MILKNFFYLLIRFCYNYNIHIYDLVMLGGQTDYILVINT